MANSTFEALSVLGAIAEMCVRAAEEAYYSCDYRTSQSRWAGGAHTYVNRAYRGGQQQALEECARRFERPCAWQCLDHGGEEVQRIAHAIRTFAETMTCTDNPRPEKKGADE